MHKDVSMKKIFKIKELRKKIIFFKEIEVCTSSFMLQCNILSRYNHFSKYKGYPFQIFAKIAITL